MFGIAGLDWFGLHSAFGIVALWSGGAVLYRRTGYAYALSMLFLNGSALAIYDLTGRFGPFHMGALVSLATVAAALVPAVTRRPADAWLRLHAEFMCWSYVGLVSAFLAEIAVRVPGVDVVAGAIAGTVLGIAAGGLLIHRRLPIAINEFGASRQQAAASGG
jgi:hypothetical protein